MPYFFPRFILCSLALYVLAMAPLYAQQPPKPPQEPPPSSSPELSVPTSKKQPVEIEADQQLEWLRQKFMYRGTGNVVITQGDSVIRGDYAEAYYDGEIGPSALTRLHVKGNVIMTNQGRVIHGDEADYDTATEILIVTGDNIKLTAPQLTAYASEQMEYHNLEHKAVAKGNAEIIQPTQNIKADTITAFMHPESGELQRARAVGNVLMTKQNNQNGQRNTPPDIAQSHQADYDKNRNQVELKGNVKLTRGGDHMQGDHAVIDLTTGYSTLKNTSGPGKGRVRAVFNTGN